jgi:hypothetical protein
VSDEQELDLVLRVLDQQLVDADGQRCGRVDDVELEIGPGDEARARALLVGPGAQQARTPPLLRLLGWPFGFGDRMLVEVPWPQIRGITHVVKLDQSADALGLAEGDRRLGQWLGRLPKSR